MADYHPLIARAVAGLDKNTGENRRALYERARTALVAQLRGVQPALEESEITRERLALEEAIRKVEAESARRAREEARPPPPPPRRPERAAPPPSREPAAAPRPPVRSEPDAAARNASRERPAAVPSLSEEAMRGFRDVVPESSPAVEAYPPERPVAAPPPSPSPPEPPPPRDFGQYEQRPQSENLWALPLEAAPPPLVNLDEQRLAPQRPRPPRQPAPPSEVVEPMPLRSYRGQIRIGLALLAIAVLGALAWWQSDIVSGAANNIMALVRNPISTAPRDTTAPARPKITDRIGQPSPTPGSAPAVAQRVVLYEEDPDDAQGKRYVGSTIWRTEMMPSAPGRAPELAVRADIDVPDRRMTVTWSLRRNTDPSLPASHTIEIMFNLPPDSPTGVVQNVPGVLMKQAEATRGVPLAGLAVKVTPGFFLIGLSALESDMQRNLQLLKERSWFDIPIVYANNRRAILAMEKGTPGERAFNDAFAAWKQ